MSLKSRQQSIPEGWERKKLAEVVNFLDNRRVPIESDLRSSRQGIYPYYGASGIIDYIDNYIFDGEFVLLGEDGANILDRSSRLAFIAKGKIWVNNHAHILEPKDSVLLYFLAEYLEKIDYRAYNTGSAQPKLNRAVCEKIPVILPPLPEQNRIVAVLETWDQAIEKLKRKIEVKKEIKKGLMQELLTGKTRLSGYTDSWTEVKLGSLGNLISGGTPSKLQDEYWAGEIPWISSSDLRENDIKFVNIHRYITLDAVRKSATNVVPQNSVVIVSRVGVGKVIVSKQEMCTSQDFQSLVVHKSKADPYFLAYLLMLELQKLLLRNQGTSIKGFLKKDLENLIIKIPMINEQEEIASFLNTFSEEIEILQKKLLILKDQKKYLLNNLVTGSIRTPESLSIPK